MRGGNESATQREPTRGKHSLCVLGETVREAAGLHVPLNDDLVLLGVHVVGALLASLSVQPLASERTSPFVPETFCCTVTGYKNEGRRKKLIGLSPA
jgi:hypothetical protein